MPTCQKKRPPLLKAALNQDPDAQQHVPTNFIYGLGVVGGVGVGGVAEPFPPAGGKVLSRSSSRTPALAGRTASCRRRAGNCPTRQASLTGWKSPTGRISPTVPARLTKCRCSKLRSYKVAEAVYDATVVFCRRFFARDRRMADQMVQAARSGVRNISEGSGAAATSRKSEMLLTNVARASLSDELLRDYESFLTQNGLRAAVLGLLRLSRLQGHVGGEIGRMPVLLCKLAQIFHGNFQILRPRRDDRHGGAGDGMREAQFFRMQRDP